MSTAAVTVVIPTLTAGATLVECLASLEQQSFRDFRVIVVDNSGSGLVRNLGELPCAPYILRNTSNVGFGAAINQGSKLASGAYVATLNDDAVASPQWLGALVTAIEMDSPSVGMCASHVRLLEERLMDSAGMLVAADGSSKQRGHGMPYEAFQNCEEVLLPSGSAALYRKSMLDSMGGFDEDFFLYCEDTDLGLRCRRAGWTCRYAADAVVEHRYSHSAGRASALKAYYVERNRLFLVIKNFPPASVVAVPLYTACRYLWHAFYLLQGKGTASQFSQSSSAFQLIWFVIKAHLAAGANLRPLLKKRREARRLNKLTNSEFRHLLNRYSISLRKVAAL